MLTALANCATRDVFSCCESAYFSTLSPQQKKKTSRNLELRPKIGHVCSPSYSYITLCSRRHFLSVNRAFNHTLQTISRLEAPCGGLHVLFVFILEGAEAAAALRSLPRSHCQSQDRRIQFPRPKGSVAIFATSLFALLPRFTISPYFTHRTYSIVLNILPSG